MLGWFRKLLPREDRFFELFERHSRTVVGGAEALEQLLQGKDITAGARKSSISKMKPTISRRRSCWRCGARSSRLSIAATSRT